MVAILPSVSYLLFYLFEGGIRLKVQAALFHTTKVRGDLHCQTT